MHLITSDAAHISIKHSSINFRAVRLFHSIHACKHSKLYMINSQFMIMLNGSSYAILKVYMSQQVMGMLWMRKSSIFLSTLLTPHYGHALNEKILWSWRPGKARTELSPVLVLFFLEKRGMQGRDLLELWCGSDGDGVEGEGTNLVEKNGKKKFGQVCHVIK